MADISSINVNGTTYTIKDNNAARSSHTHGDIQSGGTLQTSDITIASGDKLVVTDASDSSKVARTSLAFDGSTTTQFLSKKGTFETATGGLQMDLLWTNANPNIVFDAQTVSLDLSAYNYVYIVGQNNVRGEGWAQCIWPVPCGFATLSTPVYTPGRDYVQSRNMVITTTSIEFGTCDDSRNSCKPFKIYGIR